MLTDSKKIKNATTFDEVSGETKAPPENTPKKVAFSKKVMDTFATYWYVYTMIFVVGIGIGIKIWRWDYGMDTRTGPTQSRLNPRIWDDVDPGV
jgi:hypothetical protein